MSSAIRPMGGWAKIFEIEDRLFTEWRVRLYVFGIASACTAALTWEIFRGRSIVDSSGRPACIDFCFIWVAGKFAALGNPLWAYDYHVYAIGQAILVGPHHANFPPYHFWYPPTFLFFTYPLGLMSYSTAFAVWTVVTLALYLAAVYAILPRFAALVAAVTPFVVAENIMVGENGLLTAALMGLSLACLERQPLRSGILLGLLTYKPHFGILFPFALVASRNWRAIGSATAASVALAIAAGLAFGHQGWPSFVDTLWHRNASLSADNGLELTLQSVYGLFHWAGAGPAISWIAHGSVAAMVTVAIYAIWTKPIPHSLKAAALCVGSVAVTPYVQVYDLCILTVAVAFFISDGLARGFLPGERTMILICWTGLFLLLKPFGAIVDLVILFLIARRVLACRAEAPAASQSARLIGPTLSAAHPHE